MTHLLFTLTDNPRFKKVRRTIGVTFAAREVVS